MRRIIIATVAAAVAVTGIIAWRSHPTEPAAVPAPPPAAATADHAATDAEPSAPEHVSGGPSPASGAPSGPYSSTDQARKQWEPVVEGFAIAFPSTGQTTSTKAWAGRLRPYVTRELYENLTLTDPAKIPEGHYARQVIAEAADEQLAVRVDYQEGWSMIVYLEPTNAGPWRIRGYTGLVDS